uniref:Knottin scorpion toxin-like domain-containing protein n=1 Tax=Oryza brachyantha TaxID=4533 RepID=J3LHL1_ORYBR
MKAVHAALLVAVVLVASSSSGVMADTCTAMINPGPTCDSGLCVANCQRQYGGGLGHCVGTRCKCVYTCAFPPPATN